jgi:hypothetical protein
MITRSLILAATLLATTLAAQASIVVKWGADNDIVNAFVSLNRNAVALNVVTANSPTTGNYYQGHSDPSDRSAKFYNTVYNSTDGNSRLQIPNSITPNPLTFDGSNGTDTSAGRTFAGLTLWQKSDGFLSNGTLSWSDIDTIVWNSNVNGATSRGETRFVVRNGASDFYISNNLGIFTSASTGIADKDDVTAWFSYTPTTSILAIGSAATPTLDDITAIGYYFVKVDNFTSISHRTSEFTVMAVPEPSTYALIAALGALGVAMLRRRTRGQ